MAAPAGTERRSPKASAAIGGRVGAAAAERIHATAAGVVAAGRVRAVFAKSLWQAVRADCFPRVSYEGFRRLLHPAASLVVS